MLTEHEKIALRLIANTRSRIHRDHTTQRPLSKDYEYIGILGEYVFAEEFGFDVDTETRPAGDRGIDFTTAEGLTIDVKTFKKAFNLIVEQYHVNADIYVLAEYSALLDDCTLLGWEYGNILSRQDTKHFGYGYMDHYIPAGQLRDMKELHDIVKERRLA